MRKLVMSAAMVLMAAGAQAASLTVVAGQVMSAARLDVAGLFTTFSSLRSRASIPA